MFGLKKKIQLFSITTGEVIAITTVEDPVFSSKMMGDGVAILPEEGNIYAPADGEIASASSEMMHAIGLTLTNGIELLIHVGLDTVNLKNQGFELKVSQGQKVKKGQLLLTFDRDVIKNNNLKDTVMLVITNPNKHTFEFVLGKATPEDVIATIN